MATPAWAVDAASAPGGDLVGPAFKALGALAVVLGLVLLLYGLSRRGFGFLPSAKGGAIEVVEMRSLGPKKGLCLVKVRGEEFLLGVGSDRIDFLSRIEGKAETGFEDSLKAAMGEEP